MVFDTYHHIRMHLDKKIEFDKKNFEILFSLPISLRISLRRFLEAIFQLKSCQKMIFLKKLISMSKLLKSS